MCNVLVSYSGYIPASCLIHCNLDQDKALEDKWMMSGLYLARMLNEQRKRIHSFITKLFCSRCCHFLSRFVSCKINDRNSFQKSSIQHILFETSSLTLIANHKSHHFCYFYFIFYKVIHHIFFTLNNKLLDVVIRWSENSTEAELGFSDELPGADATP